MHRRSKRLVSFLGAAIGIALIGWPGYADAWERFSSPPSCCSNLTAADYRSLNAAPERSADSRQSSRLRSLQSPASRANRPTPSCCATGSGAQSADIATYGKRPSIQRIRIVRVRSGDTSRSAGRSTPQRVGCYGVGTPGGSCCSARGQIAGSPQRYGPSKRPVSPATGSFREPQARAAVARPVVYRTAAPVTSRNAAAKTANSVGGPDRAAGPRGVKESASSTEQALPACCATGNTTKQWW